MPYDLEKFKKKLKILLIEDEVLVEIKQKKF